MRPPSVRAASERPSGRPGPRSGRARRDGLSSTRVDYRVHLLAERVVLLLEPLPDSVAERRACEHGDAPRLIDLHHGRAHRPEELHRLTRDERPDLVLLQ